MPRPKKSEQKSEKIEPYYTSLSAAAAALGITPHRISLAKRNGCTAFESNRVHSALLIRFLLAATTDEGGVDWDAQYKQFRAKKLKLEHDRESGRLVDVSEVDACLMQISEVLKSQMRMLVDSMAPKLEGLRADVIASKLTQFGVELCQKIKNPF